MEWTVGAGLHVLLPQKSVWSALSGGGPNVNWGDIRPWLTMLLLGTSSRGDCHNANLHLRVSLVPREALSY